MKHGHLYQIAIEGILLCVCALLLCSGLSFNMGDPPSEYAWPHNETVQNWIGQGGAFAAYYMLYYFGPGAIVGLFGVVVALFSHLGGKPLSQPVLRAIGLVLVMAAVSTGWFLLWPDGGNGSGVYRSVFGRIYASGDFPWGNGGILGVAAGTFLPIHLAELGTWIVLTCSLIVGAILAADTVVLTLVRWFGFGVLKFFGLAGPALSAAKEQSQALGDIWTRLSHKQKAQAKTFSEVVRDYREKTGHATATVKAEPVVKAAPPKAASAEASAEKTEAAKKVKPLIKPAVPAAARPGPAKAKGKEEIAPPKSYEDYELPPLDLLKAPETGFTAVQERMVEEKAAMLESLLEEFGVNAQVVNAEAEIGRAHV